MVSRLSAMNRYIDALKLELRKAYIMKADLLVITKSGKPCDAGTAGKNSSSA